MRRTKLTPRARAEIALDRLLRALERWDGRADPVLRVAVVDRYREFREASAIAEHTLKRALPTLDGKTAYKQFCAHKRRQALGALQERVS